MTKKCVATMAVCCMLLLFSGSVYAAEGEMEAFHDDFNYYNAQTMQKASWSNGGVFDCIFSPDNVTFSNGMMSLKLDKTSISGYKYAGAEYRTKADYGYGSYRVSMKAIKNDGVVSSFFTYTGPAMGTQWDEIDIEFLGKDTTKVQFNFFTNGVSMGSHLYDLGFDASEGFHEYGFDWSEDAIIWYVDGEAVYQVTSSQYELPSTPGRIMMNVWNGKNEYTKYWLKEYDGTTPLVARYKYMDYRPFENSNQESAEEGTVEGGTSEDGAVEDGVVDEGTSEGETVEDGVVDDGTSDGGVVDDGTSEGGTVEDGVVDDEASEDGVVDGDAAEDDIIENEIIKEGVIEDEFIKEGITEDEIIEDEVIEDEVIEDEIIKEGITKDEVVEVQSGTILPESFTTDEVADQYTLESVYGLLRVSRSVKQNKAYAFFTGELTETVTNPTELSMRVKFLGGNKRIMTVYLIDTDNNETKVLEIDYARDDYSEHTIVIPLEEIEGDICQVKFLLNSEPEKLNVETESRCKAYIMDVTVHN